jgi:general secretion pathway protein G
MLLDMMLTVVIMSILAATIIPQFEYSIEDAHDAVLANDVYQLRRQIELYKLQHEGRFPGAGGVAAEKQMMAFTDSSGIINDSYTSKFRNYPYFNLLPANPFNDGVAWKTSSDPRNETPDQGLTSGGIPVGWFYNPTNGQVSANAEGFTAAGVRRIDL